MAEDAVAIHEADLDDEQKLVGDKMKLFQNEIKSSVTSLSEQLRSNRELIKLLKKENKEMKSMIMAARKGPTGALQNMEIAHLDREIFACTLKLDEQRDIEAALRERLFKQREQNHEIELNSQPILTEEHFLTRKIKMLENRLDKSLIKYNEAVSIKRTYEQIVKRLRDERVGFDNQLAAIERTLKAKDNDYQELLKMSHAANHAKEEAKRELQKFKLAFDEQRKAKDAELKTKKTYVQSKVDQTQELEKKERQKRQEEQDAERKRQEEAENAGAKRGERQLMVQGKGDRTAEQEERSGRYEAAFRKIRDATGISDVHEVLQRFVSQEETQRNLRKMEAEANDRIEKLKRETEQLAVKLEDLRYSGSGQLGSRRIIEEFEVHLTEARNQSKSSQERYEHLAKHLINVKAGIEHLRDKLEPIKQDLNESTPAMSDDTAVGILRVCEQKLLYLDDEFKNELKLGGGNELILGSGPGGYPEPPQNNRRVKLTRDEDDEDDDEAANAADDQDDDAVLKRDQVKKISQNSIAREAKKMKRRGKKDKGT